MSNALLAALIKIVGNKNVIAPSMDMKRYLVEERGIYCGTAAAVVHPVSIEETASVVKFCYQNEISIAPQGGNTGLCGGGVPNGGIVVNMSRMNRIYEIDTLNSTITAEAGVILHSIQKAAEDSELLFPLSLASEGTCQIGGNISTNAGGTAVLRYGNMRDLVLGLEVVLPDGRIWNGLRSLRKDNTGYDLKHLFIGAEGTLGIITAATLKLFPKPHASATVFCGCADLTAVVSLFQFMRSHCGDMLASFEMIAQCGIEFVVTHIPNTQNPLKNACPYYVLLEVTSPRQNENLRTIIEEVLNRAFENKYIIDAVIAANEFQTKTLWNLRESLPEAQKYEGGSIKYDIAVPISYIVEFVQRSLELVEKEIPGLRPCLFGHIGDGNIHFNLSQPVGLKKDVFLNKQAHINRLIYDLVTSMGGSFSAEHGIGQLKVKEVERYKDPVEVSLMRMLKHTLDPKSLMNPKKVVPT